VNSLTSKVNKSCVSKQQVITNCSFSPCLSPSTSN
jgi:hypothetical protein